MGKPGGMKIVMPIGLEVITSSKWEDLLWDAVQEAQIAGVTPKRFKQELAQSWTEGLRRDIDHAEKILKS